MMSHIQIPRTFSFPLAFFTLESFKMKHFCYLYELQGSSLDQVIKKNGFGGLHPQDCRQIMHQLVDTVDFLHQFTQVYHKAINPSNILLELSSSQIKMLKKYEIIGDSFLKQEKNLKEERLKVKKFLIDHKPHRATSHLIVKAREVDFCRPHSLQF